MRILITGGFGFIGGRLSQYLHQSGHQIILGSRNVTSSPDWLPQAEVIQTDWKDESALSEICNGVDAVIHTAGMNAQDCFADPVAALEFNGLATARLIQSACQMKVAKFVYLSTAHVYTSPLVGVITEECCPRNPHPYATSHLAGERVVSFANQREQISGTVLRISNVFGRPSHQKVNCWMLLVNDLCRQAVQTGEMVLHSTGLQQRDFMTLYDVCRAVDHLINLQRTDFARDLYNLGGECSLTVREMAHRIAQCCNKLLGFVPEIISPRPELFEKTVRLHYDISRLKETGFLINGDWDIEILQILDMCVATQKSQIR